MRIFLRNTTIYKLIFHLAFFLAATSTVFSKEANYDKVEALQQVNWYSLYDFSAAEKLLHTLEGKPVFKENVALRVKLGLVKIRLYASTGDQLRVKYELNQIRKLKILTKIDAEDEKIFDIFSVLYGDFQDKFTYETKLTQVLNNSTKYPPFIRLLVSTKLASIQAEEGNLSKLKSLEKKTLEIAHDLNKEEVYFFYRSAYGQFYFLLNDVKRSQNYFKISKHIAIKNIWKCAKQYANLNLAETYLYSNNFVLAKKYLDSVISNKRNTEQRDLYQAYGCLEYYFKLKNNPDSSYYYLELRNEVDDIIEDSKSENLVNQLDFAYEEEVNQFNFQMEVKKNQRLKAVIALFISGLAILSVIAYFIFSQIKRTNRILRKQKAHIESNLLLKEKLIKEIHHRVKNNLQIVSSILNLQSKNIKDQKAIEIIEEGKERIQAIALIHNQLHLSKDTAFVEMDTYLLQFVEQIKQSFLAIGKDVDFDMDIENMKMAIDNAVPLGMIFCELLSNSYKHGFKEKSHGLIRIAMHRIQVGKAAMIEIIYTDNGVGYRGEQPFLMQDSTGVEIIQAFVNQLDADFTMDTNYEGFKIRLRFEPLKLVN